MDIVIDQQFKSLIPPLTVDEFGLLESSILAEGCRDPLVVWNGVLVDGHNRHEICTRHGIQFKTVERAFTDRDAVADWIDANQLGRRNLSPDAFKLLLGRRYNRVKKATAGAPVGNGNAKKQLDQFDPIVSIPPTTQSPSAIPAQTPAVVPPKPVSTAAALAVQHGVGEATVKRAAKFAAEVERSPRLQDAIAQNVPVLQVKRELKEEKREERRQENAAKIQETVATASQSILESDAKFSTIVIDPPWDWSDEGDQDQLGRARPDYATMTLDQLMDLKIPADDDCHLYLWTTNRSMPKAFRLLEKWGFRYITCLTWVKPSFGMGNYFRGQTEHVLFGVRGSLPLKRKDAGTVFHADRGPGGHSSKPVGFLPLVESCSPGPYLEMFSRSERTGWVAFGENNV
ncbi:MAG: hypothetical protein HQL90_08260 [Magnetococcales bacterium]|nr:hypothetical protein [Magnetococcales bacterium]